MSKLPRVRLPSLVLECIQNSGRTGYAQPRIVPPPREKRGGKEVGRFGPVAEGDITGTMASQRAAHGTDTTPPINSLHGQSMRRQDSIGRQI